MSMQFERDERKFDFHDIGREIKRKREASGMTQEQLACIIDRDPRTVMYHENDGQHPSLNIFYQLVTRFDISVDLVRDIDLIKELGQVTVSWSINTLDEGFKNDMDSAVSIERRIAAMKKVYNAGIRTVCFVSPVFPGITDFEAIFERVKDQCDLFWLENLNLRGGFKKTIMDYIADRHSELIPLYDEIYNKKNRSYFEALEQKAGEMAKKYDCPFVDNEMPYGRVPQGHPVIVDYFYHEEIRGSENTGKRNK